MRITLKQHLQHSVECPRELTEALQEGNFELLTQIQLHNGRRSIPFLEIFEVELDEAGDADIEFQGDLSRVHGLGRGWSMGTLLIDGNCGDSLGELMTDGAIFVRGNTGDGAGRGMQGGQIRIHGNAGDYLGSSPPGQMKGMTGGEIMVQGRVGEFCGHRQRRGTIIVCGDAGAHLGFQMQAGTLLVAGQVSGHVGLGMQRGTIVLSAAQTQEQIQSACHLAYAVDYEPVVLRLLFQHLEQNSLLPQQFSTETPCCSRFLGDMTAGQRGEVLLCE